MLRNVRRQRTHIAPNYHESHAIRDRLQQEIADLQSKLDSVGPSPTQHNLSSTQSFRSMIHSRKQMLGDIARQKDERANFGLEARMQ